MAFEPNGQITYEEMLNNTIDTLKSKCCNIDTYASGLPNAYKDGQSYTVKTQTVRKRNGGDGSGAVGAKPAQPITYRDVTLSTIATVSDSMLVVVPTSTVSSQITEFLTSRGILPADEMNTIVTFKSMLNFYNNIASFLDNISAERVEKNEKPVSGHLSKQAIKDFKGENPAFRGWRNK